MSLRLRTNAAVLLVLVTFQTSYLTSLKCQTLPKPDSSSEPNKLEIVIVEGEGAINNVKQRVAREAIVEIRDENHKPIGAGATVMFAIQSNGAATGTFSNGSRILTLVTNAKGQAAMKGLHLNHAAGALKVNVTAAFHGHTAVAAISQTNVLAGGGLVVGGSIITAKAILIAVAVGGAVAAGSAVAVTHGGGTSNATPAATSISTGTVVLGPPH